MEPSQVEFLQMLKSLSVFIGETLQHVLEMVKRLHVFAMATRYLLRQLGAVA